MLRADSFLKSLPQLCVAEQVRYTDLEFEQHRVSERALQSAVAFQHVMHLWLGNTQDSGQSTLGKLTTM